MAPGAKTQARAQETEVLRVEFDREEDGRWIAEISELPGVMAYGATKVEALFKVQALAYRVLADRIEQEKAPHGAVRFHCQ